MNSKRQMPLRKSLNRQATLLGVERLPAAFLILVTSILVFSGMTLPTFTIGVAIFLIGMYSLRQAAIAHPQMTRVYSRYVKYRRFYPARVKHKAPFPHRTVIDKTKRLFI